MSELVSVPFKVWLLLIAATACSFALFEATGGSRFQRYASAGIIVIAFVKVRWVGLDFMELRCAPVGLRIAFEVWVLAVAGTLVGLYLMPG